MNNKLNYSAEELPFEKLERLGLSKEKVLNMKREMLEPMMKGQLTPLIKIQPVSKDGIVMSPILVKLQLQRDEVGKVQLMIKPRQKAIKDDLGLKPYEMEDLKAGDIIRKQVRDDDGKRRLILVQLDKETNSLIKAKADQMMVAERLRSIESIKNVQLGINQKQQILEGKPVEIEVGKDKITVGVDLKEPQGFKVVQGDMTEWERQQKIKWDIANPDKIGYWQTDQNRWEFKEAHAKKIEFKQTLAPEKKMEQQQEQSQSHGRHR